MGFGTIFATIAMVVIIGTASYLGITGSLFSMDTLSKSLKIANEMDNEQLKTEIEIVDVIPHPEHIEVMINNTGSTKILTHDYKYMDVFVYYYGKDVGYIFKWIPYTESAPGDNEWTVKSISPDLINPGIFDPNEQMKIEVRLKPDIESDYTDWIKVVTPNGVSDAEYWIRV